MTYSVTWADFYLVCFAVGFCFSFFSFVFGGGRAGRLHLPHFHGHLGGHVPPGVPRGSVTSAGSNAVSAFNFVTLTAFLAWFGGTGYLLTRYSGLWVGFGLLVSSVAGLLAAGVIFVFLSKVLASAEGEMYAADYEMVGVLGKLSSPIREGGTGEMVYVQMGTRRVCGARSEAPMAIARGTEVVVTRYEKGIAYVRPWSEMSGDEE